LEPLSGYLVLAQGLWNHGAELAEGWNFGPRDDDARTVEWIVKALSDLVPTSQGYEIDSQPQPHEATYLKLDISKARAQLGWQPRWTLAEALEKIVAWDLERHRGRDIIEISRSQIEEYQKEMHD
jgi:CDP-glucose 4,6-dehydratase